MDTPLDAPSEPSAQVTRGLSSLGVRRETRIAGIRFTGRRRRPSGEKAPLERGLFGSGRLWLLVGIITILFWIILLVSPATTEWLTRQDNGLLRRIEDMRSSSLTSLADATAILGSSWFLRILRIATLLALVFVRRWRHLFAVLLALVLVQGTATLMQELIGRPRPYVTIIGSWQGPSHPSLPVAGLSVTLLTMAYVLIPAGRRRDFALLLAGVVLGALVLANLYLGVDHPSDALVSVLFSIAFTVVLFRRFAPEGAFPVTWTRGVTAHLDVGGSRGEAIKRAIAEQLGMEVLEITPFGLEGSGGSTPLRLTVAGDPDQHVFAKLYSQTHLRSDRWYKAYRTIRYGSLENEVKFASVRRLVEYEDYIQRLMRDAGVPSTEPFGIVEIIPEREYLMVSEFLEDSEELTDAEIDDQVIDDALQVIRKMWDAGLAHRDIKPANVMLNDGRVVLIDVAFGTVRPSAWRQAVDLANMMVILGLKAGAGRVYERALQWFAPEDIAEAFAATQSVTLPSQSRSSLAIYKKEQGADLVEEFRDLAPPSEPISIQRWSPRRAWLTIGATVLGLLFIMIVIAQILGGGVL